MRAKSDSPSPAQRQYKRARPKANSYQLNKMKKLLLTTLIASALAASVFAQGTVTFSASSTHGLIQCLTDGTTLTPVASAGISIPATIGAFGQLNLAVYSAALGTPAPFTATTASLLPAAWVEATPVSGVIFPLAGNTLATTFTLGNVAAGGSGEVMLVGWTGTATDWNTAWASGTGLFGWTGSTLSGGALEWLNATGNPGASPPITPVAFTYGATGFNGLVLPIIPEPSTFALAGLGAAALLIFRRRK
jgi:hypothetical protein